MASRGGVATFFLALLLLTLLGAAGSARAERLPIKVYTSSEGLAHDRIQRIRRDSRGFLWFCTLDGLSRFDGYRFINYNTTQGLPHTDIMDMLETRGGTYWLATFGAGAVMFNPHPDGPGGPIRSGAQYGHENGERFVAFPMSDDSPANQVRVMFEDHAGTIWAGTEGGLFRLEGRDGEKRFQRADSSLPAQINTSMRVYAFAEDWENSVWVGTSEGLLRFLSDNRVVFYSLDTPAGPAAAHSLLPEAAAGILWIGTDLGLIEMRPDPVSAVTQPQRAIVRHLKKPEAFAKKHAIGVGPSPGAGDYQWFATADGLEGAVVDLVRPANDTMWICTADHGLMQFDGKQFHAYTAARGLSTNDLMCMAEDSQGNLWVGTQTKGAMKLSSRSFTSYTEEDGLGGTYILSIFEERAGKLCMISFPRTLNAYDGRRFVTIRPSIPDSGGRLRTPRYETLFQDREGEWWVPTAGGLYRFAPVDAIERLERAKAKAIYTTRDGLASNNTTRIFEDSRGDLWIGSDSVNPLTRWERATGAFQTYTQADGLPSGNPPSSYLEDQWGNLWMGLMYGGLIRYRKGRFELFKEDDGVAAGLVRQIYQDHTGQIWLAAEIGGLGRIENPGAEHPGFTAYTVSQGLASNNVRCMAEDRFGRLYIGTVSGVDRLDLTTNGIKHYNKADGLSYTELGSAFRDSNGALWFGMWRGLSRLIPEQDEMVSPPVFISGLRIAGTAFPIADNGEARVSLPELEPGKNQIEIEFLGLDFSPGEALRYQYKLEGASSDWSAPTDQRTVSYPNLTPGSYRFLVRAVSGDGVLSGSPASVSFRLLPPVWRRWWFLTVVGLLLGAAVVSVERYRAGRVRALGESENRFRALAETASDAIFTIDDDGRICLVSPAAERIFGCPEGDMLGHDIVELIPGYQRSLRSAGLFGAEPALDVSWDARELYGVHKSGARIPLELSFGGFARDNRQFVTLIARDVTERKRAEEALRRSREERLAELERVRRRIATDLHDDIGSSLTQISILSEVMRQNAGSDDSSAGGPLEMIARSSRELVDSMSDIVWAINPQKDHLSDLTQRMRRFASDVFTARNIAFDLRLPPFDRDIKLGANLRREVFLIFKESINNMVRHSGCARAEIKFQLTEDSLQLILIDDGRGFDPARQSDGHGLMSMRERARDIGGQLEIESASGRGTVVTLRAALDGARHSDIV